MLVSPDGADFTSTAKIRSPLRQIKSVLPSPMERELAPPGRAFSSRRLRSLQDASASRSAAAFQFPCLAWWIRAADLRAISARISLRVRLSNSSEIAPSEASSASLSCDLSWRSSLGTRSSLGVIAVNVIHRIASSKKESGSAPRCPPGTFGGGVEHHHGTVHRGQGAVGVPRNPIGLKSWWPGVSRRLKARPSCSKLITAEETEMPRRHLTAIQSERTRRRSPRGLTSPASWIAPPNSSNFD